MIPYIITFVFAYLFVWMAETIKQIKNNRTFAKAFIGMAILILSVLAALRDEKVGTDVLTYVNKYFEGARDSHSFAEYISFLSSEYVEIGYKFLTFIISRFTDNVRWLYFFIELIDCSFVMAFLWENRKRASMSFGLLVYMLMIYNTTFNAVRQMMAVCICIYSLNAARDRKLRRFIIEMVIACLIHRSSILMIISYPLVAIFDKKTDRKKTKLIYIVSGVAFILLVFINPIVSTLIRIGLFPSKFSHYIGESFSLSRLSAFIFLIPVFLIFKIYQKQFFKLDKMNALMLLYAILWPIVAQLDSVSDQFGRMAFYFSIANIYLYAELPKLGSQLKNKKNIQMLKMASIFFMMAYWYINYNIWQVGSTVPYIFGI